MLTFLLLAAAAAAPGDGKTMAMDDWHALAVTGVDPSGTYLQVHAGDLDGDGLPEVAVVKLTCAAGKLTGASYIVSPRDSATGQASGKRQHKPVTFVKEWGAASPQLMALKPTYNIKELKSARTAADGWTAVSLSSAEGLCDATQAAAATIVKSKSNITNN